MFAPKQRNILFKTRGNWSAPWKNRTSWYISFFHPSLNGVLFPIWCSVYWWKGSVRF